MDRYIKSKKMMNKTEKQKQRKERKIKESEFTIDA